ncbi:MAG: DEAD/DEAH box helicase [Oscillospiraceae bacterium]|nr:DEAD/DEAH box helicase [Oscillospiraceae bacterium]
MSIENQNYSRLAPYIQEYIYHEGWNALRPVQNAACEALFSSDDHLLLSSGTASGKTEAAFLPILTLLGEQPPRCVGILYISPLKALINDQFARLKGLLEQGRVPICRWHGDVSSTAKERLLQNPRGLLQITPESLESLLTRRPGDCPRLFAELRFVIVDEVHAFMAGERGLQLMCLLQRLERLCGCAPRRVGLSATISNPEAAARWLSAGTQRACRHPVVPESKRKLKLLMECFPREEPLPGEERQEPSPLARSLYQRTLGKKTIVFTKSRLEAEQAIAALKEIARANKTPDVYRVHHGSVSAALREQAEREMRRSEIPLVTGATVTLELGLDVGDLEQVVQLGAPVTVSSFAQRIGRCGRQGQTAELYFAIEEDAPAPAGGDPLEGMHWELVRAIAVLELYLKERWIEPAEGRARSYGLLYHQTMCALLANGGETSAAALARQILTLEAFQNITQEEYRLLLRHLLALGQLQRGERGGLLVGIEAEHIVNHHDFLSVFTAPEEYEVRGPGGVLGSVSEKYKPGERFALAGRTWQTLSCDEAKRVITVHPARGAAETRWESFARGRMHARLLERMREILRSDTDYAYLSAGARLRLSETREIARQWGITERWTISFADGGYAVFPWVDTAQLQTLRLALRRQGIAGQLCPSEFNPIYLTTDRDPTRALACLRAEGIDIDQLPVPDRLRAKSKFDPFLPPELLLKQTRCEELDAQGLHAAIRAAGVSVTSGPPPSPPAHPSRGKEKPGCAETEPQAHGHPFR